MEFVFAIFVLNLVMFVSSALAVGPSLVTASPTPTHSAKRVWVGHTDPGVRIQVDQVSHGVAVTVEGGEGNTPKAVDITFYGSDGQMTWMQLQAVHPGVRVGQGHGPTQAQYSGVLSQAAESFVGFELKIPFGGTTAAKTIRSEDLKNPD